MVTNVILSSPFLSRPDNMKMMKTWKIEEKLRAEKYGNEALVS